MAWRGADRARSDGGGSRHRRTIFKLEEGLDSGPVALSRAEAIRPGDTRGTLGERLSALGAALLIEALDQAEAGALELQPQPEEGVTYAEKIDPVERRLDPARAASELERIVRAFTPGIGAYLESRTASGWGSRRRASRTQASARAPWSWTTGACWWDAPTGRSSCCMCVPRADGRCRLPTTCAGTGPARDWPADVMKGH